MNSSLLSLSPSQSNLINSTTWLSNKKLPSSSVRLQRKESETQSTLLPPYNWLLSSRSSGFRHLQCFVLQVRTSTQVVVDLPTHPTQATRTSLNFKLQGQVVLIIGHSLRLRATSVVRKVTMLTSATKGAFRLLHLSSRQAMLLSSTTPSMQEST